MPPPIFYYVGAGKIVYGTETVALIDWYMKENFAPGYETKSVRFRDRCIDW